LTLHLQISACHLFDATSGLNLLSTSASSYSSSGSDA
jgi:oligogalacturonide transport system ATP-binding protein